MKEILELIVLLSCLPLGIFALTAILNAFTFPRLRQKSGSAPASDCAAKSVSSSAFPLQNPLAHPLVSVLIPMRNEADIIAETVKSLLAQDYPNLEILLLDDQSADNSAEIALKAANHDPRLRVIPGAFLPHGWLGKTWACQQLSEQAGGDYLLFTDADVRWQPGAVSALLAESRRTSADLLTAWPTQITKTWSERLVVPLMAFAVLAYLPVLAVHHLPWSVFAAANGQCLFFRRAVYQKIGGHIAIKKQIVDDMAFAYAVKRNRLRLRAADANGLIQTRMYHNWTQVRDGFAKNILAGHGNSVLLLLFSAIFHWWLFIIPWLILPYFLLSAQSFIFPLFLITLGITTRALTAATSRQRIFDSIFLPVSVFLMTIIAVQSMRWHFSGGPQWKGRTIPITKSHNHPITK